jgi:hypothetical protein
VIRLLGDPLTGGNIERFEVLDPDTSAIWLYEEGTTIFEPTATVTVGWVTNNCTGTAYVFGLPPPRYAFAATMNGSRQLFVRPDGVQVTQIGVLSRDNGAGCQVGALTAYAAPLSMMKTATQPPAPPGNPPYHPEVL